MQGQERRTNEWQARGAGLQPKPKLLPSELLPSICPAQWLGEPPPYDWLVDGCFLRGTVAMVSGDGGLGKSLLMQQLCTAAAIGRPWLGLDTQPSKSLAMFCEDDLDELQRRQFQINKHYGCTPTDLEGKVEYAARVGQENVLVEFNRNTDQPIAKPLMEQFTGKVKACGAQIVILDTLADVFAGNEIVRNQVRRFISQLRKVAMEIQGTIILTAHPSLTGLNTGSGISGSTAWNNSVRSRLYLTKPKSDSPEEEEAQQNDRLLKTMKNNQGPWGGKIRLRWENGVFARADLAAPVPDAIDKIDLDVKLTEALRQAVGSGSFIVADPQRSNGFAVVARKHWGFFGHRHSEIVNAQARLINQGKIVKVEMGPQSKRRIYLRTSDTCLPGEQNEDTSA